jgi:micrococcal nuclease
VARITAWLAIAGVAACVAADVPPGPVTAKVASVVDGDTLKVTLDGRTVVVRLVGVDTPEMGDRRRPVEELAEEALAFTRRMALGQTVLLERDGEGDARDAYDRELRYVVLPDGKLLNAEIIAEGYGQAYTRYPFSRLDEFRALERAAREAERGLWSPDGRPTIEAAEARAHLGEVVEVCATVASARYLPQAGGQPTFLNLERPHPDQSLTVVIWGSDRAAFGVPEQSYDGRRICVTGKIREWRGKPEIIVSDPSQIEPARTP